VPSELSSLIQVVALAAIPVVLAITLHEAAHGYIARYFGDPTAYRAGRISLNPLRHIDPVGTIAVPLITLAAVKLAGVGVPFGWAKPVPVDFAKLRDPKRDMLWVAAAGPAANLAMAFAWAVVLKLAHVLPGNDYSTPLQEMAQIGIVINAVLMVLNLFPLPPLDGGRIAVSLLPGRIAWRFARLERYGFIILLVLLFSGVLGSALSPFVDGVLRILAGLFNLG
jgi:Zn-dependent protease